MQRRETEDKGQRGKYKSFATRFGVRDMTEGILHHIWKNRVFEHLTLNGQEVQVLDPGKYNVGDGPDFDAAVLKIGTYTWVGSVEIHVKSSDWVKHQHMEDPRYEHIILHVVKEDDQAVYDRKGERIPTAVMETKEIVVRHLIELELGTRTLRCSPEIGYVPPNNLRECLQPLLEERILSKITTFNTENQSPHVFFYKRLMRYLGAHRNNQAMEMLAECTPLSYLKKHTDDPLAIESILLGQGGLLSDNPRDDYEQTLLEKYNFYKNKFGLQGLKSGVFRKLRVRPPAYPARAIALATTIICREAELAESMASCDIQYARELLAVAPSTYWMTHIDFAQPYPQKMGGLSGSTINSLLINALLPSSYLYHKKIGNEQKIQEVLEAYELLPAENNQYIKPFKMNGFAPISAGDSQRLIQLYTQYCEPYKCLLCPLAPVIIERLTGLNK